MRAEQKAEIESSARALVPRYFEWEGELPHLQLITLVYCIIQTVEGPLEGVELRAYFNADITEDDREYISLLGTELVCTFPPEWNMGIAEECIHYTSLPSDELVIYQKTGA